MLILLASLLLSAPPGLERLFAELDVGLPGKAATAVALSPRDDRIILAAVDGILFRSDDGGITFQAVLKPQDKRGLSPEEQLRLGELCKMVGRQERPLPGRD